MGGEKTDRKIETMIDLALSVTSERQNVGKINHIKVSFLPVLQLPERVRQKQAHEIRVKSHWQTLLNRQS